MANKKGKKGKDEREETEERTGRQKRKIEREERKEEREERRGMGWTGMGRDDTNNLKSQIYDARYHNKTATAFVFTP